MTRALLLVAGLVALLPAFLSAADEAVPPAKPAPVVKVGEELPFMVADFVNGRHHCGCPSAMIGNHDARALLIWSRVSDPASLELIRQIDPQVNDGNRQGYLITFDEEEEDLKAKVEKLGLKQALAGVSRHPSKQIFAQFGIEPTTQYAVMLVDDKAVRSLWQLPVGGLTKEQSQKIMQEATAFLAPKIK